MSHLWKRGFTFVCTLYPHELFTFHNPILCKTQLQTDCYLLLLKASQMEFDNLSDFACTSRVLAMQRKIFHKENQLYRQITRDINSNVLKAKNRFKELKYHIVVKIARIYWLDFVRSTLYQRTLAFLMKSQAFSCSLTKPPQPICPMSDLIKCILFVNIFTEHEGQFHDFCIGISVWSFQYSMENHEKCRHPKYTRSHG